VKRRPDRRAGNAVVKSDDQWRDQLSAEQYAVLRRGGTERPGTENHGHAADGGEYVCVGCGATLFSSRAKYDSGTGWPSFTAPVTDDAVQRVRDVGLLGVRTEVRCASCAGHLGHVFQDGPAPTGERYCMNSVALRLESGPT
jgi:peptide-methionine (R)-S-oxide reductase